MSKINLPFDLNCDLGEGMPNDGELMPFLGSCNIACGGHAGNELTIKSALILASKHQVMAGAHPSYPDKINFGRKHIALSKLDFQNSILSQLKCFERQTSICNVPMHHIKPHGALYNRLAVDTIEAEWLIELLFAHYPKTILYVPPQSVIERSAMDAGIPVAREVFADRSYQDDLTLVNRTLAKAVLTSPQDVLAHISTMVYDKYIVSISGKLLPIEADTLCIHGDNPKAIEILKAIQNKFNKGHGEVI